MFDFSLLPLFISVLVLTLIVLAIGIHFARNIFVMITVIPIALVCVFSTYKTVTDILGYPILQTIPDESFYISHLPDPSEKWIFVWLIEPRTERPKNVKIPNTEKNQDELDRAADRGKMGIPQQLRGKQIPTGEGGPINMGDYEAYDFVLDNSNLKQYTNN